MDIQQVDEALIKLEPGLHKYKVIMEKLNSTDVSKDKEFQKLFNGFYRIRQRKQEFYQAYYLILEESKGKNCSFGEILEKIYKETGRFEASFSSKLFATVAPHKPVWDSFVLQNLGLKAPYTNDKRRMEKIIILYDEISKWYEEFLHTQEAKEILSLFNDKYPNANITDVKKIDLILWQIR